jgi:hypothetical protein
MSAETIGLSILSETSLETEKNETRPDQYKGMWRLIKMVQSKQLSLDGLLQNFDFLTRGWSDDEFNSLDCDGKTVVQYLINNMANNLDESDMILIKLINLIVNRKRSVPGIIEDRVVHPEKRMRVSDDVASVDTSNCIVDESKLDLPLGHKLQICEQSRASFESRLKVFARFCQKLEIAPLEINECQLALALIDYAENVGHKSVYTYSATISRFFKDNKRKMPKSRQLIELKNQLFNASIAIEQLRTQWTQRMSYYRVVIDLS